jgi:hypothetical protein
MKSYMIFGAIVGFLIGIGFSLNGNCSWSTAFWRGCAVALAAGVLTRWWGRVWLESLRDAHRERQYKRVVQVAKPKTNAK